MAACAGCQRPVNGSASVNGYQYCHPDDSIELDCYHMKTVYGWDREEFDNWLAGRSADGGVRVTWMDVPQGSYPGMTGGMSPRDYLEYIRGES